VARCVFGFAGGGLAKQHQPDHGVAACSRLPSSWGWFMCDGALSCERCCKDGETAASKMTGETGLRSPVTDTMIP
jgi:hypothetical protein